jgi:thiol:disulfide interchange protein
MPIYAGLPRVNFNLVRKMLIALLCLQLPLATANDFADSLKGQSSGLSNAVSPSGLAAQQDEFLPVTEAYKLSASVQGQGADKVLHLVWEIAPHYYLYLERFKFRATPALELAPAFKSEGIKKFDEFAGKDMTILHNQAIVDLPLPASTPAFELKVTSQGCAEAGLCYPPYSENLRIDPSANTAEKIEATTGPRIKTTELGSSSAPHPKQEQILAWQALLFAFLGGIILNLMPCVFPVLSIKVLSLVQNHGQKIKLHGVMYTLGIVLSFLGFAGLLLAAKAGGQAVGWGFQLQSPGLVIALTYLFFMLGLAMAGYVQLGGSLMGIGQKLTQQSGLQGSFFTGVLAAVVASPCTAPFMGAALGFALTQPAYVCLFVFCALGLGMALPLLLLCMLPSFAQKLPRPGLWMETLKEFLAFPLFLSAVWLLWVLTNQAGSVAMAAVCAGATAIAFAFWIYRRQATGLTNILYKTLALLALILAITAPYKAIKGNESAKRWQTYSPALVADLRAQGRPVFIDVTADWCITCLANERSTLMQKEVEAVFDELKVATLKADWTNEDPEIRDLLQQYGRIGVPLYLWFPVNHQGPGIVLPQILTPSTVIETLKLTK